MQKTTIKAFLEKLGLSQKETLAYLYCLEHGPQLVTQLGKVTGTTRTNTYDIIKKLEQKGLCHTTGSSYGRKIKANNPEDIKDLLDNKSKEIKDLKNDFEELLPLLKKGMIQTPSPFTRVSYFEGVDSVRKMLWQSLQSKEKNIRIAGSELDMASSLGKEYVVDFHTRRKTKSIYLETIRPDSNRLEGEVFKNDKAYLREIRIRPKGKIRLKSNIILWDNYIALYSLKDKIVFGTLIESDDMAIMLGSWFDIIWEHSKNIS
jgi:sugar-specific transcriptional regulator TrmB